METEKVVKVWEIEFNYGKTKYEYEINAKTKAVISKDIEIGKAAVKKAMLKKTGLKASEVTSWDIDHKDKKNYYAVVMQTSSARYTARVTSDTGKVKKFKKIKTTTANYISQTEAIDIALAHAGKYSTTLPKASQVKIKLDTNDKVPNYDIEFTAGSLEFEYEIDARTGKIREWEKESILR